MRRGVKDLEHQLLTWDLSVVDDLSRCDISIYTVWLLKGVMKYREHRKPSLHGLCSMESSSCQTRGRMSDAGYGRNKAILSKKEGSASTCRSEQRPVIVA
jgi:hypothetical protein